jgi:hypothetical protein
VSRGGGGLGCPFFPPAHPPQNPAAVDLAGNPPSTAGPLAITALSTSAAVAVGARRGLPLLRFGEAKDAAVKPAAPRAPSSRNCRQALALLGGRFRLREDRSTYALGLGGMAAQHRVGDLFRRGLPIAVVALVLAALQWRSAASSSDCLLSPPCSQIFLLFLGLPKPKNCHSGEERGQVSSATD